MSKKTSQDIHQIALKPPASFLKEKNLGAQAGTPYMSKETCVRQKKPVQKQGDTRSSCNPISCAPRMHGGRSGSQSAFPLYIHVNMCMRLSIYICVFAYVHMYIYTNMYVYAYVCICIYVHIQHARSSVWLLHFYQMNRNDFY